jgi:hypothetical protein
MCGFCNVWVCVCVGVCMCGCFGNMCTCIYCVLYCLYCVFVLFRLCIFILICSVCTAVRTTAIGWQLNCSSNNNNNNNNNNNACAQLAAPTEYVKRHDGVAKVIHQKLAEASQIWVKIVV